MCFTTISEGEKKITTDLFIDLSGHEDGQVTLWQFEQSLSLIKKPLLHEFILIVMAVDF
jgi:hypothetical protein